MCYHQTGSARFIGHCWGRGWRDATENLLQTSIINHLGSFPLRRICGTKKVQLFLFLCASRFRWGAVVRGGGVNEQKNKQTKHWQQVTRAVKQGLPRKLTGVIFLCSENKSQTKTERDDGCCLWTNPHYYTNALPRSVDTWEGMRHIHFVDNK